MTVLRAVDLAESHPYLAANRPGWRKHMELIIRHGGPWECPVDSCGGPSYLSYRCSKCGHDLTEDS